MTHYFTQKVAGWDLLKMLLLTMLLNVLVMAGTLPYGIAWGGRISSQEQMLTFEGFFILINLFIAFMVAMYLGAIKRWGPVVFLKGVLWPWRFFFWRTPLESLLCEHIGENAFYTYHSFALSFKL